MRIFKNLITTAFVALVLTTASNSALAAETCGNGIDDDADGYADEGCGFANWVMGVCESPMSCTETGDIDPVTGAWVYQLPADIAPAVPFGPKGFEFRRTYMSMYAPPSTNYRTAMGNRWQHNFQSWLDKSGTSVVVHLPTGQEVKFTYTSTPGDGYDYYNAIQPGMHFKHLRQAVASPNNWELRTLTGEVYKYNWTSPTGKLIEIWDSLAQPNKITIAYLTSGGSNGQIDTVTDASGKKRFKFSYSQNRVSSVAYQTVSGATGTTRVTLSLSYTSSNPTTVQLGGTTIQTNTYTSGYLTNVADGGGKTLVNVNYSIATPGKVANVTTANGGIGYDFASSHAQCSGQTALFFNLANANACEFDTDCTSGFRCGGRAGAGGGIADGKCYRAARCMTTISSSENLVTTVTPFTPCTGACAPTAQYSWNTTTLDLMGLKLADNNWTSYQRDANGMVTLMAEGDTDDTPANTGGAKSWFFYGSASFPGRLTETRRQSDVTTLLQCDASQISSCKRTQYFWNTSGLLATKQEDGLTYGPTGSTVSFVYSTAYVYDLKGRLEQVNGPLTGLDDVTDYTYWTSSDVFKDGYPNLIKRKKNTTDYVTTTLDSYDYLGNAGSTQDPDGTFTCRTWDSNRNFLSQIREAMNGQASCATSHASDLVTNYVRDTALRMTKTTNPLGDCEHTEYDTFGRLEYTKLRDDCVATNAGSTLWAYYDANGLSYKTEWLDSSGVAKRRKETTFADGTQVASFVNPVSPSYSRTLTYLADATRERLTFENSIGKTEWTWDAQNRETDRRRYTDGANSLEWHLDYPLNGNTAAKQYNAVADPSATRKIVTTNYDDVGRKSRMDSPDSKTTVWVYDAASRVTTRVEALHEVEQVSHAFAYDNTGRRLTEDYGSETACPSNPVDVTNVYDAGPASTSCPGVTLVSGCPTGATCTRLSGRLAHAKEVLLCTGGGTALYQETFFGYDDNGRVVSEFICDTTGRTAQQNYSWDKNGNLTDVKTPSVASMTNTYDSTGNSDANLVTALARTVSGTPTTLLTSMCARPSLGEEDERKN